MTDQRLAVSLFGAPRIVLGLTPLKIQRRTTFALLVYLALTGRPHAREELVALSVGELVDRRTRHAFRNALAELRRLLGDYVVLQGDTIALDTGRGVWVDVVAFEAALAPRAAAPDVPRLEAAVALYQDDLLAGFGLPQVPAFDDWIVRERTRLRAMLVRALQVLLDNYIKRRALDAALAVAGRLLELEPWREEVHRDLMRLLAWSGQRSAAIEQYAICRRILQDELRIEPDTETTALHAQLCAGPLAPPNNLPRWPGRLVGRECELAALREHISDPACRLITILGGGGLGKSRLALELAAEMSRPALIRGEQLFPDGVYLVALSELDWPAGAKPGAAAATLARALGRAVFPGDTPREYAWSRVVKSLRAGRMLLVLDNAELIPACGELLGDLLYRDARCTLLVTSQLRLGLEHERVLEIDGLGVPAAPDGVEQSAAGSLFIEHAGHAQLTRRLSTADHQYVLRICRALEGQPLALILAAGALRLLSCADLAGELERAVDLLENRAGNVPARQRSVPAALDYSLQLLATADQAAIHRLAVFSGGFDRQAAQAVADVSLRGLRALRDASMLRCGPDGRYRLPGLLLRHLRDRLPDRSAEAPGLRFRHAAYYAELLSLRDTDLHPGSAAIELVAADQHNIVSAWEWAVSRQQVDLLEQMREGMSAWFEAGALYAEGAAFFAAATRLPSLVERPGHATATLAVARGFLLAEAAYFFARSGQTARAQALLEQVTNLAQEYGASDLQAHVVFYRGALWALCGPGDARRSGLKQQATRPLRQIVELEPAA